LRWSQRSSEDGCSIATRRRREAAPRRMRVEMDVESGMVVVVLLLAMR
jgi:hypothetical protein